MHLVVDASVAVKWLIMEDGSEPPDNSWRAMPNCVRRD